MVEKWENGIVERWKDGKIGSEGYEMITLVIT